MKKFSDDEKKKIALGVKATSEKYGLPSSKKKSSKVNNDK